MSFSLFFPPVTIVGGIPSFPVRTSWFLISEHWGGATILSTCREPTGRFRTRQSLLTLGANSPTATSPKKTRGLRVSPAVDLAQKDGQTMKDCPSRLAVDVESVSLLGAGYWSWHRSSDASNYASSVPRCNLFVMGKPRTKWRYWCEYHPSMGDFHHLVDLSFLTFFHHVWLQPFIDAGLGLHVGWSPHQHPQLWL